MMRTIAALGLATLVLASGRSADLRTPGLHLQLAVDGQGGPALSMPSVFASPGRSGTWRVAGTHAELDQPTAGSLRMIWTVDAAPAGALFRLGARLRNQGAQPARIDAFRSWSANWDVAGGVRRLQSWDALTFQRHDRDLASPQVHRLCSRLHSSEDKGANPYWVIAGPRGRLYFALEWCGGWEAEVSAVDTELRFAVRLPPEETQLVLGPGEEIAGPALWVAATRQTEEALARAEWMDWRSAVRQSVYRGRPAAYPLVYNHWYAMRFDVNAEALRRQLSAAPAYGFDAFVIDAGWYEQVGEWTPGAAKFQPAEFEQFLRSVKQQGLMAGIWTCPQFIGGDASHRPAGADLPGLYSKFIGGYLLPMRAVQGSLPGHVELLRQRYSADWWKYDQALFTAETREGVMRNVVAFQDALHEIRRRNPDLIIENCQSGGRMINEFTALLADLHWLRDGGGNGLKHARQNVETALGAMEFLFPWSAFRWTNNPDRMDPNDDELLRLYCRSAMAGVWGISADLPRISPRQLGVIVREIQHYRRLHQSPSGTVYDLELPRPGADIAGVTFSDPMARRAAAVLYRWDRTGAFEHNLSFSRLRDDWWYQVRDADSGTSARALGTTLRQGIPVRFTDARQSAILFIERNQNPIRE
jgi:hypothetical protein